MPKLTMGGVERTGVTELPIWNSDGTKVDTLQIEDEHKLQAKTITPSTTAQTATPDSGYDGLSSVTVGAIATQEKTVAKSASAQEITPDSGKYLTKVTVPAYDDTSITTEEKTVTITDASGTITPDSADAMTAVNYTVSDANLTADHIEKDVTILGVTGTYEGSGSSDDDCVVYFTLSEDHAMTTSFENLAIFGDAAWASIAGSSGISSDDISKAQSYIATFDVSSGEHVWFPVFTIEYTGNARDDIDYLESAFTAMSARHYTDGTAEDQAVCSSAAAKYHDSASKYCVLSTKCFPDGTCYIVCRNNAGASANYLAAGTYKVTIKIYYA